MESLSIIESLKVSVLGFAVVFFVLVLISLFISLVSKALSIKTKKAEPAAAVAAPAAAPAAPSAPAADSGKVPAPGSLGQVKLFDVDNQTAAMVMAIVADELGAPLNELRFISIKERNNDK